MLPRSPGADRLFDMLCDGRRSDKATAFAALPGLAPDDQARLRERLRGALAAEFPPGEPASARLDARAKTWMVHALARLWPPSEPLGPELLGYLDPQREPTDWVAYWALAGLVEAEHAALLATSRELAAEAGVRAMVRALAQAVLVRAGELAPDVLLATLSRFDTPDGREPARATLRALHLVPWAAALEPVCALVERVQEAELAYEGAIALGALGAKALAETRGPTLEQTQHRIAAALHRLVGFAADRHFMDMARWAALRSLGRTGAETSIPVLLRAMHDDNPLVAHSAGQALAAICGTRRAVGLVVDDVARLGGPPERVAEALRAMDRLAVVEALAQYVRERPAEERPIAQQLLIEIGGLPAFERLQAQSKSVEQYIRMTESVQKNLLEQFREATRDARRSFYITLAMDLVLYLGGVVLIFVAVWLGIDGRAAFAASAGAGGVASFIATWLIGSPRQLIATSLRELVAIETVFASYIRQLHQLDLTFAQRVLEDRPLAVQDLEQHGKLLRTAMEEALRAYAAGMPRLPPGAGDVAKQG